MKTISHVFVCAVLSLSVAVTGCSTYRKVQADPSTGYRSQVRAGEKVVVHLKSGGKAEMVVQKISDKAIVGKSKSIPISEVSFIEVKEASAGKTTALVGGVIVVGTVLGIAVLRGLANGSDDKFE